MVHQLDGLGSLHHVPGIQHDGAISDIARAGQVVGDVEEADAALLFQLLDQVEDAHADGDIQHRDRLIRQDDLRIDRQGARHRDPLALAAGQLMGVLTGELLGRVEPDGRQQAKDACSTRRVFLWIRIGRSR